MTTPSEQTGVSPTDLLGTLKSFDRCEEELVLLEDEVEYLILLIEEDILRHG